MRYVDWIDATLFVAFIVLFVLFLTQLRKRRRYSAAADEHRQHARTEAEAIATRITNSPDTSEKLMLGHSGRAKDLRKLRAALLPRIFAAGVLALVTLVALLIRVSA